MPTDPDAVLARHVADGTVPGGVILFDGPAAVEPTIVAGGAMSVGGPPMRTDAIMRIMSMTKVVTAVAALRLVEQGHIALQDPVSRWIPELAEPRVLRHPAAELTDTVPAAAPITLEHLLTQRSGYGMILADTPLQHAMAAGGVEAGPLPVALGAGQWLEALTALPLAFQPGRGWRYHHSYGLLGILLSRISGVSTGEHLATSIFEPLGMGDTGFWVPPSAADRLPAAYRHGDEGLIEIQPAADGFFAAPPPFDVSHADLVSTAADLHTFLRSLRDGALISAEHLALLRSDRVPDDVKRPEDFFPGFWDATGWGYGVSVVTDGPHRGRYGWSGGLGTDFFVDPDGTIGILLTQVEMGEGTAALLEAFQQLGGQDRTLTG